MRMHWDFYLLGSDLAIGHWPAGTYICSIDRILGNGISREYAAHYTFRSQFTERGHWQPEFKLSGIIFRSIAYDSQLCSDPKRRGLYAQCDHRARIFNRDSVLE
jgi:hypothetical protein